MDINKEKIAHEKHLLSQGVDFKYLPNIQYNELENVYELIEWDEEYSEALNEINSSWCTWQAAKAQAVPGWVSVEDSLPNRQVNVLVASKHDFVCIASLTNNHKNNKFYDGDGLAINSITHWMPLPKPPKSTGAS